MLEIIIKVILGFLLIYLIWFFTGGVERGEQRRAAGVDSFFIGVDGTALNSESATSSIPELQN